MSHTHPSLSIGSIVERLDNIEWKRLEFIQKDSFKEWLPDGDGKLYESLIKYQFADPFKVWENNGKIYCLDGKHRWLDLQEAERRGVAVPEKLPAVFIQCENEKEAAELVLVYSSAYAKITRAGFIEFAEMYELNAEDLALSISIPSLPNMEDLKYGIIQDAEEDDYEIPDEVETDIQPGDLFQIGDHVLLCGSSLEKESWQRVMGNEIADMVNTDPPYNVNYEGGTADSLKIENDNMTTGEFYTFLKAFFDTAVEFTKHGAPWYVWHADTEGMNFRRAMTESGIMLKQCLIWVKNAFVMGRQDYHWRHEPCLYGWKPGAAHNWYGDRSQSTVLEFDRPQRNEDHPTMKPVALIGYQIGNSSRPGDIVADGFGGSGTSMVACEQLKRKCRAIELSPKYCKVIVDRMLHSFPGIQIFKNGLAYANVK